MADTTLLLKQHNGGDVRFTTMFDLYKLFNDFPGTAEADNLRHLPYERVKKLEAALAANVGDSRLIPYIQLHEFETILFCDPDAFASYYPNRENDIAELKRIADDFKSPELIDDGEHSAPSKRIARWFADYPDAKPSAPAVISKSIPLQMVRDKCPHFNQWLTALETLPEATGDP